MKSAKKLGFFVAGMTSIFVSSAVITNTSSQVQAAELVTNGSFELDPLVNTDYDPTRTNPFITGWVNDSQFFGYYNNNLENYANSGNQSVHLGYTPDNEFAYLSQTLNTVIGEEYELSYYLASAEEAPRLGNVFQTYISGNLIDEKINVSLQPEQPFVRYSYKFVATSETTELKFATQVQYDWLNLDDVSVKPVPEPLSVSGIAVVSLLGLWLKRKQLTSNLKP